jgi:hypothetical protein
MVGFYETPPIPPISPRWANGCLGPWAAVIARSAAPWNADFRHPFCRDCDVFWDGSKLNPAASKSFVKARNLHKHDPTVAPLVNSRRLASVASGLLRGAPVRLYQSVAFVEVRLCSYEASYPGLRNSLTRGYRGNRGILI